MKKNEIFGLHTLLARIRYYFEEERPDTSIPKEAFKEYDSLDVSATHVDDNKTDHEAAVITLATELAAQNLNNDTTPESEDSYNTESEEPVDTIDADGVAFQEFFNADADVIIGVDDAPSDGDSVKPASKTETASEDDSTTSKERAQQTLTGETTTNTTQTHDGRDKTSETDDGRDQQTLTEGWVKA
ncbi:UPF0058 family protein [Salinibaculum rarum]|uniref:UPF0058 family protein n=1 Tax=Salinibaculum rarum TaxID=3058903 RepID=UPI00265EE008|nr:UPF0058 family protein [Salinibaculum sp. KK48]